MAYMYEFKQVNFVALENMQIMWIEKKIHAQSNVINYVNIPLVSHSISFSGSVYSVYIITSDVRELIINDNRSSALNFDRKIMDSL